MKKLFLPILMLLSCVSCNNSNNNDDVTEFVVYEENEKFLIADLDVVEIEVIVTFIHVNDINKIEYPSDATNEEKKEIRKNFLIENNTNCIEKLKLDKYSEYTDDSIDSYNFHYNFTLTEFSNKDKSYFESLNNSNLVSSVSINEYQEWKDIYRINPEYYNLLENEKISFEETLYINLPVGVYSNYQQYTEAFENYISSLSKENVEEIKEKYKDYNEQFFENYSLVVLGKSVSSSGSNRHTLYDVYVHEGKLYALVEIAIAYNGWANIQEQYHAIKISKDTSSQILDNQVEILSI